MKPFTKGAAISALWWVPDSLTNETIPYTLIVDAEGTIRFEHKGAGNYDTDLARGFLNALSETEET